MTLQVKTPEKEQVSWEAAEAAYNILPATDVIEKKDRFIVTAELPGISADDINVSVADNMLTIQGDKKSEREVKEEDYRLFERSFGSFFRSIELPPGTDPGSIEATFENGVLTVTVPKTVEAAARTKIPVKQTVEA